MKIALINPPMLKNGIHVIREDRCEITDRYAVIPPYSLLIMAQMAINMGHEVFFKDYNIDSEENHNNENLFSSFHPDILIYRFTPTTFDWDNIILDQVKAVNNKCITIGICYTLHSQGRSVLENAKNLDIYIGINWETVLSKILLAIETNAPLRNVRGLWMRENNIIIFTNDEDPITSLDSLPLPAFYLIDDIKKYRPNAPTSANFMIVYASKGCPFACKYCTVARTPYRIKSAEKIMEEIRLLYSKYEVRQISFFDETFTLDRDRVISLCRMMIDETPGLIWYCNTRVNLVDMDLMKTMSRAGCRGISFGIESGSQEILDNVSKGIKIEQASESIKNARLAGLKVYTSFIIGLPGENKKTINETIHFIKKARPHGAQFNIAVPYPGTQLYDEAIESGIISKSFSWNDLYQHKATMHTDDLSEQELENFRKIAYFSLYTNPGWILNNFIWVLNNPNDFKFGIKYYIKALKNLFIFKMEHAH